MTINVLFLCTHNSARSILAEGILNHLGGGRFSAFSAGSAPGGRVNPFAIRTLEEAGIAADGLRSKSWDEFAGAEAQKMDLIFTVCDNAAGEACPYWPGHPASAHWGLEDPSAITGGDEERMCAFAKTFALLRARIEALIAMPIETLDRDARDAEFRRIGRMDGATAMARAT